MTDSPEPKCEGMTPFACGNPNCPAHPHLVTDPLCKHYCGVVAVPGGFCPTCNPERKQR